MVALCAVLARLGVGPRDSGKFRRGLTLKILSPGTAGRFPEGVQIPALFPALCFVKAGSQAFLDAY